jgi:hypothetical protein
MSSIEVVQSVNDIVEPSVKALEAVVEGGKLIPKALDGVLQFGSVGTELLDPVHEFIAGVAVIIVAVDDDDVKVW